jgi:modification methylase
MSKLKQISKTKSVKTMKSKNVNLKIYNKDSRKISKFIKPKTVSFVVFSPPYWNLRNYGYDEQIGFKQTYEKYLEDMKKVFSECFKVLKDGRHMAINIGTVVSKEGMKFVSGDFVRIAEEVGFIFRKDIIWHKPRGTTKWQRGGTQFTQNPYPLMFNTNINHEYILIFQKGETGDIDFSKEPEFNRTYIRKLVYSTWDIIPITSPKLDEKHVAPYPEEIPRRLIQLYSFKNEIVLDPFAGCGTTNKVAVELGRKSIAVELSKEYCNLIKKKVSSAKYDLSNKEIYNHGISYAIKDKREKLDKAVKNYKKAKKELEEMIKQSETEGLENFL